MLQLSGVPVLVRDQSEFSDAMAAGLRLLRSSPAPELAVVQRQHADQHDSAACREQARRWAADSDRKARVDAAMLAMTQGAGARRGPEKPPVKHDAAPEWARTWIANFSPLMSVLAGAEYLARDKGRTPTEQGMYKSLLPNGHNLSFSTMDLIDAMPKEWLPPNANGDTINKNTISEQLKRAYPDFKWAEGRTNITHRKEMKPFLERAVHEGLQLVRDDETDQYLPENILRLVSLSG